MVQGFADLERYVLDRFSDIATSDTRELVKQQIEAATFVDRKFSGAGFFTNPLVPKNISTLPPDCKHIGGVDLSISSLLQGCGFILFVRDGRIAMLEGYCFEASWSEEEIARSVVTGILGHTPSSTQGLDQ